MEFKPSKCELIINKQVQMEALPAIFHKFHIGVERVEVLGIPTGDDNFIDERVILKLINARAKLDTTQKFTNDKIKSGMIRKFNGVSKLMYLFSNIDYNPNDNNI